ncbi:MAG: sulfotransferase family protein [Gaiellales bacterium]
MTLRVVGAGLGRTGTHSLKLALEQLLGGRCYHMSALIEREDDTAAWAAATRGDEVDWPGLLSGFTATVDWPACGFWEQIASAAPDAVVLLSMRESPEAWWGSFERTIAQALQRDVPPDDEAWVERRRMVISMMERTFTPDWPDRDAAIAAYERHNQRVRDTVPAGKLVEWKPGDGWEPICTALGLEIPSDPFPHTNTRAEFREHSGLE